MAKIILDPVTSINSVSTINTNFDRIKAEFQDKVTYRDNPAGETNTIENLLDMNGNHIINLPAPASPNEAARLQDIINATSGILPAAAVPFTPAGPISATNVQAAIEEVISDLANNSDVTLGAGLIGYKLNATGSVGQLLTNWLDERISVTSFGAIGNGVADDSVAFQKALDVLAARGSGTLWLPGGHTYKAAGLTWVGDVNSRLVIHGDGASTKLLLADNSSDLFFGDGGSIDISDMEVGHATHGASTGGFIFRFSNSFANLRRIDVYNGYNVAIWDEGCDQCGACDILARGVKNDLFVVDVSSDLPPTQQHGNLTFERIRSQAYNDNTGAAFRLTSGDGVFLTHVQAHGYQNGVIAVPSATRSYLANLFFDQVIIDGAGGPALAGPGAYFDGTNNPLLRVYFSNSWVGSIAGGKGIHAKHTKTFSWQAGTIIDNAHEGVLFDAGCEECTFMDSVVTGNGLAAANTYAGILVFDADAVRIAGNRSGATHNGTDAVTKMNTQKYGIHIANASTINYSVYDNDLRGNLTTGLQDGGGVGGRKVVRDN